MNDRRRAIGVGTVGLLLGFIWMMVGPYASLAAHRREHARFEAVAAAHPDWKARFWQSEYVELADPASGGTGAVFPAGAVLPPQRNEYLALLIPVLAGMIGPALLVYALTETLRALDRATVGR